MYVWEYVCMHSRVSGATFWSSVHCDHASKKQELSYRQQIARQLRTQYAEGIYMHKYYTVTLKSRLRITQGHWKRNHWIDHTRLNIVKLFDVEYYCDLQMWVRGHWRSLKVVSFESLGTVSYSPSIVTMAVSAAILEIFSSLVNVCLKVAIDYSLTAPTATMEQGW